MLVETMTAFNYRRCYWSYYKQISGLNINYFVVVRIFCF